MASLQLQKLVHKFRKNHQLELKSGEPTTKPKKKTENEGAIAHVLYVSVFIVIEFAAIIIFWLELNLFETTSRHIIILHG